MYTSNICGNWFSICFGRFFIFYLLLLRKFKKHVLIMFLNYINYSGHKAVSSVEWWGYFKRLLETAAILILGLIQSTTIELHLLHHMISLLFIFSPRDTIKNYLKKKLFLMARPKGRGWASILILANMRQPNHLMRTPITKNI